MNPPPSFDLEAVLAQRDFIRSIARGLLGDDEQAEDVVQDTCLLALERPPTRAGALRAWMAQVARNLALNARRREGERPERERRAARPERVGTDEERDLGLEQEVVEAVRSLPQPHRTTIYLRFYKGLGPTAIAEELGVPVSTVKTRLTRGLELVREDLDRRHGGRTTWSLALLAFALPELAGAPLGVPTGGAGAGAAVGGAAWKGLLLMNKPLVAAAALVAAAVSVVLLTDPFASSGAREREQPPLEELAQPELAPAPVRLESARPGDTPAPTLAQREVVTARPTEAPVAQPAAAIGLMGRVVDAEGRPVAGAEVQATSSGHNFGMFTSMMVSGNERQLSSPGEGRNRTDSNGRFLLPVEEDGMLNLVVDAAGFAPFRKELTAYYGRRTDAGELQLTPEVVLSGRVLDQGGRPVPGARVRSSERFGPANVLSTGAGPAVVAVTDASGRFTVGRQAAGPWSLSVSSDRHKDGRLEGRTEAGGERVEGLELVLEEGMQIAGRVTGRPQDAGPLWVRATPDRGMEGGMRFISFGGGGGSPFGAKAAARVAADGTFTVAGLEPGKYKLTAYDSENLFGGDAKSEVVSAAAGDDGVALAWSQGASLAFRVVDGKTGEPLERFQVTTGSTLDRQLAPEGRPVQAYPGGEVLLEGLRVEGKRPKTNLTILAEGYALHERAGISLPAAGAVVDLGTISLVRLPMAYVTVVDSAGAPIEGAEVRLAALEEGGHPGQFSRRISISLEVGESSDEGILIGQGRTGADGVAAFPSQPGQSVRVEVTSRRHADFESDSLLVPSDEDFEYRVVLLAGAAVEVVVRDLDGSPLPGARVEHRRVQSEEEGAFEIGALFGSSLHQRTTDSEGKAWFRNLGPGTHGFRLAAEDPASGWMGEGAAFVTFQNGQDGGNPWTEVEVYDGDERQVVLSKQRKSLLAGRVNEGGQPLHGARLTLSPAGDDAPGHGLPGFGGGPETNSDGAGKYAFEDLNAGAYTLEVSHPERAMPSTFEVEVTGGSTYFDVDLDLAMVEGRITDAEGKGIPGVRVRPVRGSKSGARRPVMIMMTATSDGSDEQTSVTTTVGGVEPVLTDAEGYYVLRGVPSRTPLVIEAEADDWSSASTESFEVSPDQVLRNMNLVLEKGGSLRVTVWDEDGKPASNALILLRRLEGEEPVGTPEVALTSLEGVATFGDLKAGPWQVRLQIIGSGEPGSEGPEPQRIEVQEGLEAAAHFDL